MDNKTKMILLDEISYLKQQVNHITDRVTQLEKMVETEDSNLSKKEEPKLMKIWVNDILNIQNKIFFRIGYNTNEDNISHIIYVEFGKTEGLHSSYMMREYGPYKMLSNRITDPEGIKKLFHMHNNEMVIPMMSNPDLASDYLTVYFYEPNTDSDYALLIHTSVFSKKHL